MKSKLLIIGAGGHGKVVADIALKMGYWTEISFLDDNRVGTVLGLSINGTSSDAHKYIHDYDIFVAIGNNAIRKAIQTDLEEMKANIPILVHPASIIGSFVKIGKGTVIMAGVVVNCDVVVGKGCILNTGSTVDHDSIVGDFVHISPGVHIAGGVNIGSCSWLGIGSVVSNNVTLCSDVMLGAGALVINSIHNQGVYVGVPARRKEK